VLDAVQLLEREGYTASIDVRRDGIVHCSVCSRTHAVNDALVDRVFRFEGASDPDDEAIVLGVRCPHCGAKGVVVSGFGPSADPRVLMHLQLLDERFRAQ
jgi:hypothetical protein